MDKLWYLKHCDLFSGLRNETIEKIGSIARERNIPGKQIIYSAQDKEEVMFILKKGRVRIFKLSADGRMITMAILKDGDTFGAMSIIKGGISGAFAETLEDSYICAIRQEDFSAVVKEMPEIALKLIEKINQKLKEAESRIEDLVFRDVPGRIASILLKLAEQFGKVSASGTEINFRITHQELADMVGATRETVTVILSDFKNDGIVQVNEKHMLTIDDKALREWVGRE